MSKAHFFILRFRGAACLVKSGTHPGRNSEINANFAYIIRNGGEDAWLFAPVVWCLSGGSRIDAYGLDRPLVSQIRLFAERVLVYAEQLLGEVVEELHVVHEIALEQSAGLFQATVEPLHS